MHASVALPVPLSRQSARPTNGEPVVAFPRWALGQSACAIRRVVQAKFAFPLHDRLCQPFRVEGLEYLRSVDGPVIFIANHTSLLDSPTVMRALPRRIRERVAVAAAADYFYRDWRVGLGASLALNAFPFARHGSARASLRYCEELVSAGWSILIYREGTRGNGDLLPLKGGVALLARDLRVPIVPMAIVGPERVLPKGQRRPRPGPVTVRIGAPMMVAPDVDRRATVCALRTAVADLMTGAES